MASASLTHRPAGSPSSSCRLGPSSPAFGPNGVKARVRLRLDEQGCDARMMPADFSFERNHALLDIVGALLVGEFDAERGDNLVWG
jgi:hypothetical protein